MNETMNLPKSGDSIYIPTSLYTDRGEDDVQGGLATIKDVVVKECSNPINTVFITVEEVSGHSYNWHTLMRQQEELKERFGNNKAHNDPDYSGNTGGYWSRGERWK